MCLVVHSLLFIFVEIWFESCTDITLNTTFIFMIQENTETKKVLRSAYSAPFDLAPLQIAALCVLSVTKAFTWRTRTPTSPNYWRNRTTHAFTAQIIQNAQWTPRWKHWLSNQTFGVTPSKLLSFIHVITMEYVSVEMLHQQTLPQDRVSIHTAKMVTVAHCVKHVRKGNIWKKEVKNVLIAPHTQILL